MSRWRSPLLHALLLAALLRLPLMFLPGPGRDEAAYHYWSRHPELFYAPLLQWLLRLSELLPVPAILSLRMPSVIAGALVLVLVDLRMRALGTSVALRWLCLLALVVSEWQTYTGAILHPDQLLVAGLLLVAFSATGSRVLLFSTGVCLAAMAKPTGLLFIPVAWVLVGRISSSPQALRVSFARLAMLACLVLLFSRADRVMLEAMAQYGRMDGSLPWILHVGGGLFAVLITGGPMLLLLAAAGVSERVRTLRDEEHPPSPADHPTQNDPSFEAAERQRRRAEAWTSLALAGVLLGAFGLAAVLRGQIKANWILPAAVLLLPLRSFGYPRWLSLTGLGCGLAVSLIMVQAHLSPQRFAGLESALARGSLRYELHAGTREGLVSPTRSWVERLSEYRDLRPFVDQVERGWGGFELDTPVRWIVSDDYGLACQLIWYRHNPELRLVVPRDGIYHREMEQLRTDEDPGTLLLLGVQMPADELWSGARRISPLFRPAHPITGDPLQIAAARRAGKERP